MAETLGDTGFVRSHGDSDIWFRPNEEGNGYDYVGTHTDDLLVVANNTLGIFESLKELYTFKSTDKPSYHLGVDYHKEVN